MDSGTPRHGTSGGGTPTTPRTPRQLTSKKAKQTERESDSPTTPPSAIASNGGENSENSQLRKEGMEIYSTDPAAFDAILEANGWTKEDLFFNREKMTHMELFLLSIAKVPQIAYFPNLVDCKMMHIGLEDIGSSFEKLKNLQKLWLNENRLTKISGLENCSQLKELYLHGNEITKINNLQHLTNLEVLWLSNNRLTTVSNLEKLTKLRSLWLAGNNIVALDKFYSHNLALEDLNVAGNQIASFREVPPLSQLPKLSKLYFADPTFGDNPLTALCNYTIFTLYHLPKVSCLDYMVIGPEQRQLANSTFTKKTMYYMMRIKTLRRNTLNLIRACESVHGKKQDEISLPLDSLQRQRAILQQELTEVAHFGDFLDIGDGSTSAIDKKTAELKEKLTIVDKALAEKDRERVLLRKELNQANQEITKTTENQVSRLLLELNTGGNVRIEEGKSKDVWHKSCVELVKTRFFCHEFDPFGIRDVKITKVSRLYNRALRGRFDSTLDELVDIHDHSYKRALEYLFFVDVDGHFSQDNMFKLLESGFRQDDFPNGIPMTNSLFLAEQMRMVAAFKNGELSGRRQNPRTLMTQILVAKVFLGKCAAERGGKPTTNGDSNSQQTLAEKNMIPVVTQSSPVNKLDYADTTLSVYRAKPNDSRQRIWFCMDSTLVLPEYIVDAAYVAGPLVQPPAVVEWGGEDKVSEVNETVTKLFPNATKVDMGDYALGAPYYLSMLKTSNQLTQQAASSRSVALATETVNASASKPLIKKPVVEGGFNISGWHKELLHPDSLKKEYRTAENAPEGIKIEVIDLSSRGLGSLAPVFSSPGAGKLFANLTDLVLSFNEIGKIDLRLDAICPGLISLDLSYNNLRRVEGAFNGLLHLEKLKLNNNMIQRTDDVLALAPEFLPELSSLSLASNPVQANMKSFRSFVVSHLTKLKSLDDQPTSEDSRLPTKVTAKLIVHCLRNAFDDATTSATEDSKASLACALEASSPDSLSPTEESMLSRADSLQMVGFFFSCMAHAMKLRNLSRLDLSNNCLNRVDGLGCLTNLIELNLEHNSLKSMEGLGSLSELRRLELGRNKMTSLDPWLSQFPNLMFLSMEENDVTSISKLAQLHQLTEAYFAGNKIVNGKEVNLLRELPRLIIMDLSNNPCTSEENYRLYTIFQLKKLKVLDGVSVDPSETTKARDKFAGRVNAELLNERVGEGKAWCDSTELSLASCALKEVTMMESFAKLMHLKLDHNALVDISGLSQCKSLVSLNLAYNKLGTQPVGHVLEQLPYLESISMEANGVQSLAQLQLKLPALKFLNVKANDIMKIEGMEGLPQLREMMIDKNKLRSIDRDCFVYNHQLRELYAEENSIKTLEGVKTLSNLIKLSLAVNRISEIGEIDRGISGLNQVIEVCFLGNPVVRKSMYRLHVVHMLPSCSVIDNKEVTIEERERGEQIFSQETQIPPNVFTDVRSPVSGGGPIAVSMPNPPGGVQPGVYQQRGAPTGIRLVTLDGSSHDQVPGPGGVAGRGRGTGPPTSSALPGGGGMSRGSAGYRTGSADYGVGTGGVRGVGPRGKSSSSSNLPRRR